MLERELNDSPEESWSEGLVAAFKFAVRASLQEIPRRKFTYCLAFTSVFVVVLSSLVINSVIQKGPIVFLSLAEQSRGEIDGFVTPYGSYQ